MTDDAYIITLSYADEFNVHFIEETTVRNVDICQLLVTS